MSKLGNGKMQKSEDLFGFYPPVVDTVYAVGRDMTRANKGCHFKGLPCTVQSGITKCVGWKRPSRSSSPTHALTPQLDHGIECHIQSFFKHIQVSLQSHPTFQQIDTCSQLSVICKFINERLNTLIHVINKNIEQNWPQHRPLRDTTGAWLPAGCSTIHCHSLGPAIQPVPNSAKSAPVQAMGCQLIQEYAVGDSVKGLAEIQIDNIHSQIDNILHPPGKSYSLHLMDLEVRLYARPDAIRRGSGDYALNITRRLIEFYEDYFKVPYSLPKLVSNGRRVKRPTMVTPVFSVLTCEVEDVLESETLQDQSVVLISAEDQCKQSMEQHLEPLHWYDLPYFYPKQFESTKYIIKGAFHRVFIEEEYKTVNELMENYSSSSPARNTTTSDAHQKCEQCIHPSLSSQLVQLNALGNAVKGFTNVHVENIHSISLIHYVGHLVKGDQWFGDLVTPVWWEDVWLKEGFAHYFEFVGTDYLYPGWNMEKQRFLTDVLHEVMLLDGLASSHPVSQEVQQASDIDRVFDWIAYKKRRAKLCKLHVASKGLNLPRVFSLQMFKAVLGAALIRMLANFMGHSVFQMGLQDYLTIHKYGNAARNDLWNTLSKALKRVGKSVNIQEVMDQWTLQMGYPVITILGNETTDNIIVISQERFVYDSDTKPKDPARGDNSYLWQIPLTIAVGNTSHISSEAIIWVSNKSEHHRIPALEEASWLLGNINQTGYFRVNYDIRNWRLLINQLTRNHEVISVSNRAGLIDDAFNLARAGYLPQNIPLEIMRELRREVIMLACSFGNKHCHQQAATLISDWISSNRNRIPLNVRDIVYCTGVSLMDEDVWEFIWMKFHSTTAVSEKKILLEALTCSDDRNLLNRLLNLSLNSEVVLDQDAIDVIIHVARNPHGRDLAWKFFREKWKILNARYGEALFMNSKLVSGVTEFLNTEGELRESLISKISGTVELYNEYLHSGGLDQEFSRPEELAWGPTESFHIKRR
ncbi:hypothetical protein DUI87_12735 [Hirundo rustica rustica]|uniref:Aminopeptidase n=1 Tax=Hirundo rustica rustica TaxID=333673 RepID=A0A3M0K9T7_HIRRU|nr:hypothetical protein DUI87_12735 [Hirundo rustica rustica]